MVDPPGSDPKALLQRTALNLDGSSVIFGFGGNDGDCSDYKGAVVSVPESGGPPSDWQVPIAAPSSTGGAVWGTGGPAVDGAGNIYASTGNPNPPSGQRATTYDYSDSVVQLNPALSLTGQLRAADLGTGQQQRPRPGIRRARAVARRPRLSGRQDRHGLLIDEASLAGGAAAVYSHQVCAGAGSFGGDAYRNGVIYLPCTNGVQALAYNAAARTFAPLWQGPSDAFGPPITSAGLVWTVATGAFSGGGPKLYGLDPATGKARYTETLPDPVADHFASPSAAGGRVLVATGSTVSAYQVATLTTVSGAITPGTLGPRLTRLAVLVNRHLHAGRRGLVRMILRCPPRISCHGTVIMKATLSVFHGHGRGRHRRAVHVEMIRAHFGTHRGQFTFTLHLAKTARTLLSRHHRRLHVTVAIALPGISTSKVDALLSG